MIEYRLFFQRRSGGHAVAEWIAYHFKGRSGVLLNSLRPNVKWNRPTKYWYIDEEETEDLKQQESGRIIKDHGFVITTFEDPLRYSDQLHTSKIIGVDSKKIYNIIVTRDIYNNVASRLKHDTRRKKKTPVGWYDECIEHWKQLTSQKNVIHFNYNLWMTNKTYRISIGKKLDIPNNQGQMVSKVENFGGGSSFTGVRKQAIAEDLLNRWKTYTEESYSDSFQSLLDNEEVRKINQKIFGWSLDKNGESNMEKQEPPFAVQLETTEGCNLYCGFCGIRGIRSGHSDYKFMTLKTARRIAKQIRKFGWRSRLEFAMHGEPTINPLFIEIVKTFRKEVSNQIMVTTNGIWISRLTKKRINDLFNAGVNIIAVDDYRHNEASKKIRLRYKNIHDYPREKNFSPHNIYPKDATEVIFVEDISTAQKGTHSMLNNHCGCASKPLTIPMKTRCAKPFRELSIRWDGNIAICCNDWRGIYKCGNIFDGTIEDLWNNIFFRAARKMLYNNNRNFLPCSLCNAVSYRVGLLPDKMGRKSLSPPNLKERSALKRAIKGTPYTKPVLRKWER
jgi:MoaA/NifB/PqqE/SkfB family radical SAM enzyme